MRSSAPSFPTQKRTYPLLLAAPEIQEVVYYATCNRVEVLCVTDAPDVARGVLAAFLGRHPEVDPSDLARALYMHQDQDAVRHLFRVAASLDALVVGEPQILGPTPKGVARPQHNAVAFGDLSDQTLGLIVRFKRRLQEGRRIFHRGLVPLS